LNRCVSFFSQKVTVVGEKELVGVFTKNLRKSVATVNSLVLEPGLPAQLEVRIDELSLHILEQELLSIVVKRVHHKVGGNVFTIEFCRGYLSNLLELEYFRVIKVGSVFRDYCQTREDVIVDDFDLLSVCIFENVFRSIVVD
jgi:hypothetical protein